MKKVKIIIERSTDSYWAYAERLEGVTGAGDTVAEAKQSALDGLDLQKELGNIPNKDYDVVFQFDAQSLLNYYKGIFSNAALERITGINQAQISHYANGLKKPRPAQIKRIERGLHELGQELLSVEL